VSEKKASTSNSRPEKTAMHGAGITGGVYGMAFIGALVYHLQQATTFWEGVLGLVKSVGWPAILTYKVFEFLNQ